MTDNRTNEQIVAEGLANVDTGIGRMDPSEWAGTARGVVEVLRAAGRLAKPSISQGNEGESGVGLHFSEAQFDGLLSQVESARVLAGLMRAWDVSPEQLATLRSTLESVERCAALVAAANTAPQAPYSDPAMTAPQAEPGDVSETLRREFEYRIRTAVTYGASKNYRELPVQQRADWIQHQIDRAVTSVPTEACGDCGDKLDHVGTPDGQGSYMHCWRCWYREHPELAPVLPSSKVQESAEIDHLLAESSISVLPPSTVDESKVVDEMERHRHVMVAPGPHSCSCGFVLPEDPGFSGWARAHKLHVARAVVAVLGGESRGE